MIAAIVQRKTSDLRLVKATVWTVLTAFTCLFLKSQQRLAASINQQTGANSVLNKKMHLRIHPAHVRPSWFRWLFLTENFEAFVHSVQLVHTKACLLN